MTTVDSIFGIRLTHGELEQEPNAFFIRKRWERLTSRLLRVHTQYAFYVPEEFILYDFIGTKGGIVLMNSVYSDEDINFIDSLDELRVYQRRLDEGRLVVDRSLYLPDELVDQLKREGREYNQLRQRLAQSRERVSETANSLDSYVLEAKK